MYKDLSLREKAKVIREGVRLGLNSIDDILSIYDDAVGHTFQTKGLMEVDAVSGPDRVYEKDPMKSKTGFYEWWLSNRQKQLENAALSKRKHMISMPEFLIRDSKIKQDAAQIKDNFIQSIRDYNEFIIPFEGINDSTYKGFENARVNPIGKDAALKHQNAIEELIDRPLTVDPNKALNRLRVGADGVTLPGYKVIYYPELGLWNNIDKSTIIHERNHAGDYGDNRMVDMIFWDDVNDYGKKFSNYNSKKLSYLLDGVEKNDYYDDEEEIKSRLMEFRYNNNLNPTHTYSIDEIKQMHNNEKILDENLLNRYNDDFIYHLLNDIAQNNIQKEYLSHYVSKGGPIISPYGQWKYPGRDTIIPSNNITMDNVNYPVLGISDAGDAKIMMPWNDYKFKGSVVYEHPLIGNQFQLGGNTKPTFDLWYPTVPNQKNDTSSYDLRRAYNMLPFDEMEKFKTIDDYHLPSVAYDEKTDTYTFLKRNGHPTLNYELDWYNSGSPDALEFRERYRLDTLSLPWRYVPNTFLTGGLAKKPEPIYNLEGQVIGRRYVNKDNPKVIDSVVPQGRVNFQEFLKAKGKKARATNFEDLEKFLDSLIARGYNEPLRLAFLATSYNEMDNKGAASRGIGGNGYMGFNTIRMPLNLLNDSSKQIQYILDDTEKLTPDNWTDGGSGGPYIKNLIDAFDKFWNETNPNTATLVLNKANVRPAKLSDWYLRAEDADLMKQYMEYPELPKEKEQKQKKSNKLLDSFVDFILSGGLQNTPGYADGGNLFKKGGSGIHIKPENRGKFTRLKKRTGHSASWFKAHGTPALRKMATFELNARHWNHKRDDGGYLYSEGGFLLAPYLYIE